MAPTDRRLTPASEVLAPPVVHTDVLDQIQNLCRAMSLWPNKGEADPRPEQGQVYVRVTPVPPKSPVVPEAAPGALRLPIVGVS